MSDQSYRLSVHLNLTKFIDRGVQNNNPAAEFSTNFHFYEQPRKKLEKSAMLTSGTCAIKFQTWALSLVFLSSEVEAKTRAIKEVRFFFKVVMRLRRQ